jgi:hypothetical protein
LRAVLPDLEHLLEQGFGSSALLTESGVDGADAGFARASASLGSAVVLNLLLWVLLWVALLVSIPLAGFRASQTPRQRTPSRHNPPLESSIRLSGR